MKFSHRVAVQYPDGLGVFCAVVLEVSPGTGRVHLAEGLERYFRWVEGIRFGACYALELMGGKDVDVSVVDCEGHEYGTTELVAALVAAEAVLLAMGRPVPKELRIERGRIAHFPRWLSPPVWFSEENGPVASPMQ